VSNWTPKRILEANAYAREHGLTEFTGNQPQFSLAQQMTVEDPTLTPMDAETYKMHMDTGMACCCFSSQGKGFFSKLDTLGEAGLPDKAKRRFLYPNNVEVYERMKVVREQTGLTIGAIALAWLTCQPFPTFALCGASKLEQVLALKDAADAVITPEQRDYLRVL
jgi:aryl-alcohol dehydrogenase-like predicted oxidoreductase